VSDDVKLQYVLIARSYMVPYVSGLLDYVMPRVGSNHAFLLGSRVFVLAPCLLLD